jgi:hypothetical protein
MLVLKLLHKLALTYSHMLSCMYLLLLCLTMLVFPKQREAQSQARSELETLHALTTAAYALQVRTDYPFLQCSVERTCIQCLHALQRCSDSVHCAVCSVVKRGVVYKYVPQMWHVTTYARQAANTASCCATLCYHTLLCVTNRGSRLQSRQQHLLRAKLPSSNDSECYTHLLLCFYQARTAAACLSILALNY